MATINGMVGSGNLSMFNSYSAQNKKSSLNSLWSNYSSFSANASTALSGLSEIKSNVASVMSSYNTAKDTFYTEFDSNMSALGKAADNMKNLKIDVGENPITKTEETDEDGNKTTKTTYSDGMKTALNTVKDLVDSYNDSISFLKDNSGVSARVSRMATVFGDTAYRSANYELIGITVGSDGKLSINEDALAQSIADNPDKVSSVLGKDGLAGKAEQHIDTANSQRDRLFPTAKSMLGNELSAAALYTGKSFVNMTSISNIGNLVNMMF